MSDTPQARSHGKTIGLMGMLAVGMFGFGFALVPLYDVFCDITGLNGKTAGRQSADAFISEQSERYVEVQFDAATDRSLPWQFAPLEKTMRVRVGEPMTMNYIAANQANTAVVGHAVPSVAPGKAALHFIKTECFCFTEQLLAAGESREMPVHFVIDPKLPNDVSVLTLSYRFYRDDDATQRLLAMN